MTHATEKLKRSWTLGSFAVLSLVSIVFFNVFSKVLDQETVVAVDGRWIIPFVVLLASIALGPFINRKWWDRNYAYVSYGLGLVVLVYYLFFLVVPARMLRTFYEYVSFISLIGSL
ncbi:MAG TPA: sodium:proton antiporter, partial [Bacteroidota bacterium]